MTPPNIFPTHIALKPETRVGRRRGALIGDAVALVLVGMYLAIDIVPEIWSRLRHRFRVRDLAREREILALRQRVARQNASGSSAPDRHRAVMPRHRPVRTCDCGSS